MSSTRRIDAAAVVLRTTLGAMFIAHALLKYYVFTVPGTVKFFESLGLPGPLAYVTIAAELIGGVMLVAGIRTRIVAVALLVIVASLGFGVPWPQDLPGFLLAIGLGTSSLVSGVRSDIRQASIAGQSAALRASFHTAAPYVLVATA